jgi:hypothetical protein
MRLFVFMSTLRAENYARGVPPRHAVKGYLVYLTAYGREGEVFFRDDIYDRDNKLLRALAAKHAGVRVLDETHGSTDTTAATYLADGNQWQTSRK